MGSELLILLTTAILVIFALLTPQFPLEALVPRAEVRDSAPGDSSVDLGSDISLTGPSLSRPFIFFHIPKHLAKCNRRTSKEYEQNHILSMQRRRAVSRHRRIDCI